MQDAVDTLLALSASISADADVAGSTPAVVEADTSASNATRTVGDDAGTWPALVGNDGWEVVNYQTLEQQDLGSAWCKTAKDAIPLPSPKPTPSAAAQPKLKPKDSKEAVLAMNSAEEDDFVPTDYELRHARGQVRATKLAIKAAERGKVQGCNDLGRQREQVSESGDDDDDDELQ